MSHAAIHRAFLSWLDANPSRFAVELEVGRRSHGALEFAFAGINGAIEGVLASSGMLGAVRVMAVLVTAIHAAVPQNTSEGSGLNWLILAKFGV
jgi:hypothetical protein